MGSAAPISGCRVAAEAFLSGLSFAPLLTAIATPGDRGDAERNIFRSVPRGGIRRRQGARPLVAQENQVLVSADSGWRRRGLRTETRRAAACGGENQRRLSTASQPGCRGFRTETRRAAACGERKSIIGVGGHWLAASRIPDGDKARGGLWRRIRGDTGAHLVGEQIGRELGL